MDINLLELDVTISFKPKNICIDSMKILFTDVPESLKKIARELRDSKGWAFYSVKQRRGTCYFNSKVITIPTFAIYHKNPKYKIWYIAHELSHALVGRGHGHNQVFMNKLIEICPSDSIHYELGYKPRNASRAGILLEL